ncbi:MAG: IMP dehydrogenase, partial [Arcanobacterium sp.]|nr:IMP dehydrogenase [Arcanobacterium sp.]
MKFLNDIQPLYDLTYDDVFMVPSRSAVGSRNNVDLTTDDGTGTTIPIVVSNMTAISGKRMAETVARRGGIAIIPQDIPVEIVTETVHAVKASHLVYETPVILKPHHTCGYALDLLPKRAHQSAVVVDPETNTPVGFVDKSDITGVDRYTQLREVMSTELVTIQEGTDPRKAFAILKEKNRKHAPVVDTEGHLVGLITRAGTVRSTIYTPATDSDGKLRIGAAIGMNADPVGKAQQLVAAGVDVIVVDTAHGHQEKML